MHEVDAVEKSEIAAVERLLAKHGGQLYADIWALGINTALRISDLLCLTLVEVRERERVTLLEQKTGKAREITLNSKAQAIIARRVADNPSDVWLFQAKGNRAKSAQQPISRETVARKFNEIGAILGIRLGTHSMRKTRGAAMYQDGVPLETVCKVLNHSSPAVTMRYIGIDKATVAKTYDDYVL
jgi:integrase